MKRQRRPLLPEHKEEEPEQLNNTSINHVDTAINNLSHILQRDAIHTRILNTEVPKFRDSKDNFHEFEHFLFKHLKLHQNRITEKLKLHYFQSFLPNEAIDVWQTSRITPKITLKDILENYLKKFAKVDLKKVSKLKWDQIVYNPTH